VVTPYAEADLYEIQIRAVNDIVYIVHPDYPVASLTRIADDNWTYAETALDLPFVDPDVDPTDVTLTPSDVTGNNITITASDVAFSDDPVTGHVGSVLRLEYIDEEETFTFSDYKTWQNSTAFDPLSIYSVTSTNKQSVYRNAALNDLRYYYEVVNAYDPTSAWVNGNPYSVNDLVTFSGVAYICVDAHTSTGDPTVQTGKWDAITHPADAPFYFEDGDNRVTEEVSGEWSFRTGGIWSGIWHIQRSVDGGANWLTIKVLESKDDQNFLVEDNEDGDQNQIRIKCVASPWAGYHGDRCSFTVLATIAYGTAEVKTVAADGLSVTAKVLETLPFAGQPTVSWKESGFSPRQGYPRSIALFDNRLLLAGTKKKPQAFFYSGINEYENFLGGTLADSPFYVETLSDDQSAIQWLSAQRELFVGTASLEGILLTRKQDEAQSAENLPIVRWNEAMGSAHRAALPMRDSIMILQRGRTTLNMLSYSLERDGYTGEEVSLLCPHLFESGVQQMAHIREPYTGAFTVNEDGTMCHLIYEPKLQVTGWCKFTTKNGAFESVQVLPSTTDEDNVWVSVKRTINGTTKRHIERFTTSNRAKQRTSDVDNVWYVDAGVKVTGTDLTSVTGLDHLEGETVCVLADGIKGEYTVSSGAITLSTPADTVIAGLPLTSEFEPLDIETGQSASMRKQLYQSKLMLYKSLGGAIASDGEDYQDLIYHTAGETMDESIPLKDGYMEVFHESSHSRQKWWRIKHDDPYPFTLQAVVQSFTVSKK
jgi:hypothetical protein